MYAKKCKKKKKERKERTQWAVVRSMVSRGSPAVRPSGSASTF
jgi:hypothetical protein